MPHFKTTSHPVPPRPDGSWLAGIVIGSMIMTMATQAIILGAGTALQNSTLKRS